MWRQALVIPSVMLLGGLQSCQLEEVQPGAREDGVACFSRQMAERTAQVLNKPDLPLAFAQCLATALTNNLDLRSAQLAAMLSGEQTQQQILACLPDLSVNLEGAFRNRNAYTRSTYLLGQGGLRDSFATAAEKESFFIIGGLAWSPLDFGLSYYMARQARLNERAHHYIRERTAQKTAGMLFAAYLRMQTAQAAMTLLSEAERESVLRAGQMGKLRQQHEVTACGVGHVLETVAKQQEMVGRNRERLVRARTELAESMGIDPRAEFRVRQEDLKKRPPLLPLAELFGRSLVARPELHQADLDIEFARIESKKAWLKLFPNVRLFSEYNYDVNKHLLYSSFIKCGARLTQDLVQYFSAPSRAREGKLKGELAINELHYVSLNILVQVRLARLALVRALARDKRAEEALVRCQQRAQELNACGLAGRASGIEIRLARIELLAARAEVLVTRCSTWIAYAELMVAVGDTGELSKGER